MVNTFWKFMIHFDSQFYVQGVISKQTHMSWFYVKNNPTVNLIIPTKDLEEKYTQCLTSGFGETEDRNTTVQTVMSLQHKWCIHS